MVGVVVCDLVNAWSVGIDRANSINASIAIDQVGPVRSLIDIGGGCEVGDIGISDQEITGGVVSTTSMVRVMDWAALPLESVKE